MGDVEICVVHGGGKGKGEFGIRIFRWFYRPFEDGRGYPDVLTWR